MAKKEKTDKAKQFKFRGAQVTGYDHRVPRQKGSDQFLRIHFVADFTDVLCGEMDWEPLSHTFKNGDIKQTFHAVTMEVQPSSVEFRDKYGFTFIAKTLGPFTVSGTKTGEDSPDEMHISFNAVCTASDATLVKIKNWCLKIGQETAVLRCSYTEQQQRLPGTEDGGEGTQQKLLGDESVGAASVV